MMNKKYIKPTIEVCNTVMEEHLCFESKVHGAMNGQIEDKTDNPDIPDGWSLAKEYSGDFDLDCWDNECSEYANW